MATVALAYDSFGQSANPPLLILHGLFASARNWRPIAQKLAATHRVYALDLRNHGRSPHHPVMDYPALAADVAAFMASQGLAKASVLGHSMGGKVAMWLALASPQWLDKLVVADIAPISYPHRFAELIAALRALPLAGLRGRKHADALLAPAIADPAHRQFLLQNLLLEEGGYRWRINLDIFQMAAPAMAAFPDVGQCRPFDGQALFIAGARSDYVRAEAIAPLFPSAVMSCLANAGHWLHVQQPEAFVNRVRSFLQGPSGMVFGPQPA